MHHSAFGGVELITGISYVLILLGFALRSAIEDTRARLLWPWMLVSIFGLCGLTRLGYVGVFAMPELPLLMMHVTLAIISLAYGLGQLLYACWPELFEQDTSLPRFATEATVADGRADTALSTESGV